MIDYIYLRVSTKHKDQNPDNQLPDVKSIAPKGAIVIIEHSSGWTDSLAKRPEFARIIEEIKAGKVRSFTTWDIDRLWRKRLKIVEFISRCYSQNVIFKSYRQQFLNDFDSMLENIPKDSSMYWMIEDMVRDMKDRMIKTFAWMAEEESNKRSDRTKNAVVKKENGTFSKKGNRWGRKSLPKQTVSKVLELHSLGLSIRKIAEQVKTTDKHNNQKNISKSTVHKIISNFMAEKPSISGMSINGTIKGQESKADQEKCDLCDSNSVFASDNSNYAYCKKHAEENGVFDQERKYQPIRKCSKKNIELTNFDGDGKK